MYYSECPLCGANLDPGEKCECQEERDTYFAQDICRNRSGKRTEGGRGRSIRICVGQMPSWNTAGPAGV